MVKDEILAVTLGVKHNKTIQKEEAAYAPYIDGENG